MPDSHDERRWGDAGGAVIAEASWHAVTADGEAPPEAGKGPWKWVVIGIGSVAGLIGALSLFSRKEK